MNQSSENRKASILVAGNATLDAIIQGQVQILEDGASVRVSSDQETVEFQVEDPPVMECHKHRVGQALDERIGGLWHRVVPGGGGYNSVIAMRGMCPENKLALVYMDVSTPTGSITRGLNAHQVRSHFFSERTVPLNVILNGREDKIILRGPQRGSFSPSRTEEQEAELHITDSNAVLINSIRDQDYAERYLEIAQRHNIPTYFVVSTSLDWDFVNRKVLPAGVSLLNNDDLVDLHGRRRLDARGKMEYALEVIRRIRQDGINTHNNIYVTLGKDGAYCSDTDSIRHVRLSEKYLNRVHDAILGGRRNITGAGDVFAASIVLQEVIGKEGNPVKSTLKASEAAIRHIGYSGPLPQDAFIVTEIPYVPVHLGAGSR